MSADFANSITISATASVRASGMPAVRHDRLPSGGDYFIIGYFCLRLSLRHAWVKVLD